MHDDFIHFAELESQVLAEVDPVRAVRANAFIAITKCAERLRDEMIEERIDETGERNPFVKRELGKGGFITKEI